MRHGAVIRGIAILRILESGSRVTLRGLADRFGVTYRTIRRDMDALEAAGVPLGTAFQSGDGERGEWWLCR